MTDPIPVGLLYDILARLELLEEKLDRLVRDIEKENNK
jgi:hypothetical protein